MTFYDELTIGAACKVTNLRTGVTHEGTIVALQPDATGGYRSRAIVEYTDGCRVSVGPGFITLHGEEDDT